jgi:hypothetical protein
MYKSSVSVLRLCIRYEPLLVMHFSVQVVHAGAVGSCMLQFVIFNTNVVTPKLKFDDSPVVPDDLRSSATRQ